MGNAGFQVEIKHPRLELQRLYTSLGTRSSSGLVLFLWIPPAPFIRRKEFFPRNTVNHLFLLLSKKAQQCRKWQTVADSDGCMKKASMAILLSSQRALAPKIDSAVCKKEKKCCLPPLC